LIKLLLVMVSSESVWAFDCAGGPTVPIIGMIHGPATDIIRWRNLTRLARRRVMLEDSYSPPAQFDGGIMHLTGQTAKSRSSAGVSNKTSTAATGPLSAGHLRLLAHLMQFPSVGDTWW
jgi:hypothetical protein